MDQIQLIQNLFNAIDNKDADRFSEFLTNDCYFRFANIPEVTGKENVSSFVASFFESEMACDNESIDSKKEATKELTFSFRIRDGV